MNLEQQCVNRKLATKLKDLGVKQDSMFAWHREPVGKEVGSTNSYYLTFASKEVNQYEVGCAFTAGELGLMLPSRIDMGDPEHPFHQYISEKFPNGQWQSVYLCSSCKGKLWPKIADTESDARAKMLIYLIENKLLTTNDTV